MSETLKMKEARLSINQFIDENPNLKNWENFVHFLEQMKKAWENVINVAIRKIDSLEEAKLFFSQYSSMLQKSWNWNGAENLITTMKQIDLKTVSENKKELWSEIFREYKQTHNHKNSITRISQISKSLNDVLSTK